MSEFSHTAKKERRYGKIAVAGLLVTSVGLVATAGVYAGLSATATGAESVSSGTLNLTLTPDVGAGFSSFAAKMAPGDTNNVYVNLNNTGSLASAAGMTLAVAGLPSNALTNGSVVRSEDYWRWMIGRRYAHVIWVACQGETVRGYAFVKDHRILEIATDPAHPHALKALLGRVRAEALERAYPQVLVHAPPDHPVIDAFRAASGKVIDQEEWEGSTSMYHIPNLEKFLAAALPELAKRVEAAGVSQPVELGLTVGDRRWLLHIDGGASRFEPDKLSRRHLTLSSPALVRLLMGHVDIDRAVEEDGVESSTGTALDAARVLFPPRPIWRSPLDAGTA